MSQSFDVAKAGRLLLGPSDDLYGTLMRHVVFALIESLNNTDKVPSLNGDVVNRASLVTTYINRDYDFKMLFTGDAYDQAADLMDTLWSWRQGLADWDYTRRLTLGVKKPEPILKVDVLKVRDGPSSAAHARAISLLMLAATKADVSGRFLITAPTVPPRRASTAGSMPTSTSSAPARIRTPAATPRFPHWPQSSRPSTDARQDSQATPFPKPRSVPSGPLTRSTGESRRAMAPPFATFSAIPKSTRML